MDSNKEKDKNEVNEPAPGYDNRITFFKSFEEMNEHDHMEMAKLSYVERMQQLNFLIRNMYKKELEEDEDDNRIYFD